MKIGSNKKEEKNNSGTGELWKEWGFRSFQNFKTTLSPKLHKIREDKMQTKTKVFAST